MIFQKLTIWSNHQIGKEKIHFSLGMPQQHYTFHLGCTSKIADFHITDERIPLGNPERHSTLFQISHFRILWLFVVLRKEMPNLVQRMFNREVSIGILKKKHIVVLPFSHENNFMFNTSFDEKKHKFRLRKNNFSENDLFDNLICPCKIVFSPNSVFYAISTRYGILKKKGYILRVKVPERSFRLLWIDEEALFEDLQSLSREFLKNSTSCNHSG